MWPLARKSADPVEACGAVGKKSSLVRGGVLKSSFQELGARGAGAEKGVAATLGRPPGSPGGCAIRCSPHARERCTRGLGDLWIAQDAPPVLRSGRLRVLRGLDKPRIEQSCEPTCVFRGRRQWPQAISYLQYSILAAITAYFQHSDCSQSSISQANIDT